VISYHVSNVSATILPENSDSDSDTRSGQTVDIAFKEWAVVCRALALGQQSLIIRKGGISESGGRFQPEHSRFWLYPTHFHEQQQQGVKALAQPWLAEAEANQAPSGRLRISHWVETTEAVFVDQLDKALALDDLHIWTPETITQRFHYRRPGLFVLPVRVWSAPVVEIAEHPEYAGCKTWVPLKESLLPESQIAVLPEDQHATRIEQIRTRLS
jgi:hypothetical protein